MIKLNMLVPKPFGTTLEDKLSKAFHVIPNVRIQTNELKDL